MPRKSSTPEPDREPELALPLAEATAKLSDRISQGQRMHGSSVGSESELESAKRDYYKWDAYNTELLTRMFTSPKFAKEYSWWGIAGIGGYEPPLHEKIDEFRRDILDKIHRLESIRDRLELVPLASRVQKDKSTHAARVHTNKAFVVHGHDEASRETVARFLEKLGVHAIVLHVKATGGRTIIEKLEHYADVDFAVVLLTGDDKGCVASADPSTSLPRARQNVVLELGYFIGRLGREHVCALYKGSLELPSDFLGVGYVALDDGGGWRLGLAKELRGAGFSIDMNIVI
jgi:predicted nucleotide-binding protein